MFPENVQNYINQNRVGVLALEMLDGTPHGATLHFAYDKETDIFFFKTSSGYKKSEVLLGKEKTRASLVIGFDEVEMKTLQMDGEARILKDEEKDLFDKVYFGKFSDKSHSDSEVLFAFIPKWWRFTDWKTLEGKKIIGSDY